MTCEKRGGVALKVYFWYLPKTEVFIKACVYGFLYYLKFYYDLPNSTALAVISFVGIAFLILVDCGYPLHTHCVTAVTALAGFCHYPPSQMRLSLGLIIRTPSPYELVYLSRHGSVTRSGTLDSRVNFLTRRLVSLCSVEPSSIRFVRGLSLALTFAVNAAAALPKQSQLTPYYFFFPIPTDDVGFKHSLQSTNIN